MTALNKQALREAAEKATPGEWRRASTRFNGITAQSAYPLCGKEDILASAAEKRDAEFIAAANPATVLALLDELEAAEKRIAELSGEFFALPPLNDDLIAILGRPNFTCAHLAELLRKGGQDIRRKSEFEQAAVIYWFLDLYLKYGDKWESIAKDDIQSRVAAAGIGVKGE